MKTEITLHQAKMKTAHKHIGELYTDWGDVVMRFRSRQESMEPFFDEVAELYASQYKTEISSKEALIGELKKEIEALHQQKESLLNDAYNTGYHDGASGFTNLSTNKVK